MAARKPLVFISGTPAEVPTTDVLNCDCAVVVNESGADVDFRVESDNLDQALFVDASANTVSLIGPGVYDFSLDSGAVFNGGQYDNLDFRVCGHGVTNLLFIEAANRTVNIGNDTVGRIAIFRTISSPGVVFNEHLQNHDFRVAGQTIPDLLFVDGSADLVGIGDNNGTGGIASFQPTNGIVFNENAVDRDFRLEGSSLKHMIFCDASASTENIALVATDTAPNWQSMDRGLFLGNATTAPTGNPSGGIFLWSEIGQLKVRDGSGNVSTLPTPWPKVDIFSSTGTWTKPLGAVQVEVHVVAQGGGGGSGRKGATSSGRGGGGGGGGGEYASGSFSTGELGATETVTVGAGANLGAAQSSDSTNGNAGAAGNNSSFGTHVIANGGTGGAGGTTTGGAGGAGGTSGTGDSTENGGAGGNGAVAGAATTPSAVTNRFAGAGGGGGAGVNSSNVSQISSRGGFSATHAGDGGASSNAGGAGELASSAGQSAGFATGVMFSNVVRFTGGSGGGGGGTSASANAVIAFNNGGQGGRYGGGGGGGGSGTNSLFDSGAGGNGSSGIVIVVTYFSASQAGIG